MKRFFCLLIMGVVFGAAPLPAQDKGAERHRQTAATTIVPATGFRAEFLRQLEDVEKKFITLAQAVPQRIYPWRPSGDVRTVSEVYLHVVRGNYYMLQMAGIPSPPDIDLGSDPTVWEKSTTDKTKIVGMLRRSFTHVRQAIMNTSDADLEKSVKLFGSETTLRDAFFNVALHQHEHLGQSIAYARMNNVVPPWTSERLERER